MNDITNDTMDSIVNKGIEQGILTDKLFVSWEKMGNLILKEIGCSEYEVVYIATVQPGKELYLTRTINTFGAT